MGIELTLDELINSNNEIPTYYKNAVDLWYEIRSTENFESAESLAKELYNWQHKFESKCGGNPLGKEIMAVVGIVQFYNLGNGFNNYRDDALKVKKAFNESSCAQEVKFAAEKISEIYGL